MGRLFAAAVAIRLAALAVLGLAPETFEYEDQAKSLLAGGVEPLLGTFWAAVGWVAPPGWAAGRCP